MFEFFKKKKETRKRTEVILDEIKKLERELALIYEEELDQRSRILKNEEEKRKFSQQESIFAIQTEYPPEQAKVIIELIKKDEEAAKNGRENIFNMKFSHTARVNGLIDDFF